MGRSSPFFIKGSYDAEIEQPRPFVKQEPRLLGRSVAGIKGAPNTHISAGHFKIDLVQGEKYIKRALSNSWADQCGVQL